jgi:hypothetical protein
MAEQIGANIVFHPAHPILAEQWESEHLNPWLRPVILAAAMLYHEQGARRLSIVRLFGNDPAEKKALKDTPYHYGACADVSVTDLIQPGVPAMGKRLKEHELPRGRFVVDRLNVLFPFGNGRKQTATYGVDGVFDRIALEVPQSGYKPECVPLGEWRSWGSTGRHLTPREVRV